MCMLVDMNGFYFHVLDLPQRCSFPSHLRTKTKFAKRASRNTFDFSKPRNRRDLERNLAV